MKSVLELKNGCKKFYMSEQEIVALNNISIRFNLGKIYCIVGHSGSGKSTLIHILGLLDNLTTGNLSLCGKDVSQMNEKQKAKHRMKNIGFIFQSYFLNKNRKAIDNVMMPMYINPKIKRKDRKPRAEMLLKKVGLENRMEHLPKELSGGEQQRVAIARALVNDPLILLADEPTGNLDRKNENKVIEIFKQLRDEGKCIIIVTHSEELSKFADKIYEMDHGVLNEVDPK